MGASQDKKRRQAERQAGTDKRRQANQEAEAKRRKERTRWTIIAVVAVVLIAAILLTNTSMFYNSFASVKIGGESYSNAEYQYYYYNTYYSYMNMGYSSIIDPNTPLSSQPYFLDSSKTWADVFREAAFEEMTRVTALYEAAVAAGYTLTEDDLAGIEEEMSAIAEYAKTNDKSVKRYLTEVYGRGSNEKVLRELLERSYIASGYAQTIYDGFEYDQAELDAWYDEHRDDFDTFDYLHYLVEAETEEVVYTDDEEGHSHEDEGTEDDGAATHVHEETTAATMAAAKAYAELIAELATTPELFVEAVARGGVVGEAEEPAEEESVETPETEGEEESEESEEASGEEPEEVPEEEGVVEEPTALRRARSSSFDEAYSEWMLDASREAGDVGVLESEGEGYYVVLFQSRDDNSYKTRSARHILIRAEDSDEDGAIGDNELNEAKAAIEEIYEEWKSGEMTEESFAALAEEKSEDAGSNTNGGLYENIYKGQMVADFNDFVFAAEPGDTGIVEGSSGSYTGYHIIYYVGEGEQSYRDYLADSAATDAYGANISLRGTAYNAWVEEHLEGYEVKTTLVFKFVVS